MADDDTQLDRINARLDRIEATLVGVVVAGVCAIAAWIVLTTPITLPSPYQGIVSHVGK